MLSCVTRVKKTESLKENFLPDQIESVSLLKLHLSMSIRIKPAYNGIAGTGDLSRRIKSMNYLVYKLLR